ncbi:MAG: hypothetical protein IKX67_07310 [Bacteroidales bacterium]|nr:hypothetical protein [Bacteroidales bacterium]
MNEPKQINDTIAKQIEQIRRNTGFYRPELVNRPDHDSIVSLFRAYGDAMVAWRGKRYDMQSVRPAVDKIIGWLYQEPDSTLDASKGILLKGNPGTGKTVLMDILRAVIQNGRMGFFSSGEWCNLAPVQLYSRDIVNDYLASDEPYRYIRRIAGLPCICIEDIGAEADETMVYGNRLNLIARLVDIRCEKNRLTLGTTNLEKFSEKYDDRTISRLNGLFNVIVLDHERDFRRK